MEDFPFFTLTLISILFLFFLSEFLKGNKQEKDRRVPPSPSSLPIIGHLHLLKRPLPQTLHALSQRYGKIFHLHCGVRDILVVSSLSVLEEAFTKNDDVLANRPQMLGGKHFHYNYTTVSVAPYGDLWRNLRRVMALEILSSSRLELLKSVRQEEVRLLIEKISKISTYDSDGMAKIELGPLLNELSFNVMTMMIVGKRYYGESVGDIEEARQLRDVMQEVSYLSGAPKLADFFRVFQWIDFQGMERKMVALGRKMDEFLQNLLDARRKILSAQERDSDRSEKRVMIDNLLSLQEREPEFYTDDVIKGITMVLLTAGAETTSATMEWAMSLLLNHQDALERVKAEIDFKRGQGHLLDEQDLLKLTYLQNVVNETLRLYPSLPLLIPHQASNDCTIAGYNLPRRTMLVVNAWAIHRDPDVWTNPTKFIPERFEDWNSERFGFIPFGKGRRACPGANLANRVIMLVLGNLIRSFEWKRVSEEEVDMSEVSGITLRKLKPLEALCRPRKLPEVLFS